MRRPHFLTALLSYLVIAPTAVLLLACTDCDETAASLGQEIVAAAVNWVEGNECQAITTNDQGQRWWIFKEGGWAVLGGGDVMLRHSTVYVRIDTTLYAESNGALAEPTWLRISEADTSDTVIADHYEDWLLGWVQPLVTQPLLALSGMTVTGRPTESADGARWVVAGRVDMRSILGTIADESVLSRAADAGRLPTGFLGVVLEADKNTGRPVSTQLTVESNPSVLFAYSWVSGIWQPAEENTIDLTDYVRLLEERAQQP